MQLACFQMMSIDLNCGIGMQAQPPTASSVGMCFKMMSVGLNLAYVDKENVCANLFAGCRQVGKIFKQK